MESVRVVVTGLGAVSPLGLSVEEMWAGLEAGRCGLGRIAAFDPTRLPCELAGEVPEYRMRDYVPKSHRKATKLMCRDIELAVIAAREAVAASELITKGIDPDAINIDPARMGITMGAGMISCDMAELAPAVAVSVTDGEFDIRKWGREGLEHVTPVWLLKYLPNMLPCHVGIIHDIQGPSNTITCAEASAHIAIGEAAQVIARGDSDISLAGGAEAKINPFMVVRQCLFDRVVRDYDGSPETACRPFDAEARGAVFGEGAGLLVLESLERARERGATIAAEIAGIGQSNSQGALYDRLEPDGRGIQIAIAKALEDAGIGPSELDLIIPHGTGVPEDDQAEAKALEAVLGEAVEDVSIWPTKSMLGTTGAASGALDVIAAAKAMSEGVVPAAQNFSAPAGGGHLRISTESQKKEIRYALCSSYTHGGQTAAVVLKRFEEGTAG